MSLTGNNVFAGASGHETNQPVYGIEKSVVFDTNSYLTRTPSSSSNRKTWTWSSWVKISEAGAVGQQDVLFECYEDDLNRCGFFVGDSATNYIGFFGETSNTHQVNLQTTAAYRDYSGWYHLMVVLDTTQSTASNRAKIYINGEQVTDFSTATYPNQNDDLTINKNIQHTIGVGKWSGAISSTYYHGYMAETHFIDGTALTPASFGETNSDTNQWVPIKYDGSYGTNGFYLDFATRATDPIDASGNGNNWSSTNVIAGDWKIDSPTNNFATLNPLDALGNNNTFSEGNLKCVVAAQNTNEETRSTIGVSSGKWYWEFYLVSTTTTAGYFKVGLKSPDESNFWNVRGSDGELDHNGSTGTSSVSYTTTNIVNVAVDMDSGKWWVGTNGTWVGDPSAGSGELHSGISGTVLPYILNAGSGGTHTIVSNFGQDSSFAGNKTAQGNGGVGEDFYYTPPTGYKALNTDNLSDPSIALPGDHFNTVLYSGNSSTQSITGVGFQPDWSWTKVRNAADSHILVDVVRGDKALRTDSTIAEYTTGVSWQFDSDGFTMTGTTGELNYSSYNYAVWNWKARGGTAPSKTYTVTVTNPGSGNRYTLDTRVSGTNAMPITLEEGGTYTFDQADNSNSGHPLRFSTTSNGTHGGGSEYTTGVTTNGTPGSAGAYTRITVAASAPTLYYYCTAHSGMGAEITTPAAGGGVSNLDGTMASVTNTNTTSGFSIVKYTGSGVAGDTMGHGLSQTPEMVFMKKRISNGSDGVRGWHVWNKDLTDGYYLSLSANNSQFVARDFGEVGNVTYPYTAPTASLITFGGVNTGQYQEVNWNGDDYIMYCFHSVDGYSKVGNYTGNGNADGTFVYTGFRPAFILWKSTSAAENWQLQDDKMNPYNVVDGKLFANQSAAEYTGAEVDFVSNGFKLRHSGGGGNGSSETLIYLAIAESPFKYANAR